MCSFFEEETGLTVGNRELCVCGACNVSIRQALKARDNGEPYQLRRLKSKIVCCVPSCSSTEIEVYRHDFSCRDVRNSIGIENVSSPVNHLLCSKHYQQVYRMLNVVSKACVCCGVKRSHKHSATSSVQFVTCPDRKRVESYLKSTIDFSDTIQDGDQVCYPCYKFFNQS